MANEKKEFKNISENDLGKFQKSLSELKEAYDSHRPGFKDFSRGIIQKVDELQVLIMNAHNQAQKLDANDRAVIPELQKLVDKFDKELREIDNDARGEKDKNKLDILAKQKRLLEQKRKNCIEGITSRKKLLNLK